MSEAETHEFIAGSIITLFVCCILFGIIFYNIGYQTERSIAQHGCAHYDSQTGKWEWNKPATK